MPVPLLLGETRHGFTQALPEVVSTLHFVWEAERIVTGADHVTQIALPDGSLVWIGPVARIAFANGAIEFSGASQSAEVVRLYASILGRDPDAEGLVHWADLREHGMGMAQVAESFFGSPEFVTRFGGLSNEQLVVNLYREVLGRLPDAEGLAHQVAAIEGGLGRAQMIANFVQSPEAVTLFEIKHPGGVWVRDSNAMLVGMAYDAVFDRAPDATGLSFWTGKLDRGELTMRGLVESIANSDEFRARHAGEDDYHYVASIYRSALEREPEAAGLAFWVEQLAQHTMDRTDVVLLIGISDEQQQGFARHPVGEAFLG